jgi:hypothetical protein
MSLFKTGWDFRKTLISLTLLVGVVAVIWRIWSSTEPARPQYDAVEVAPPVWQPEPPGSEAARPSDNKFEGALRPFRDGGAIPYGGSYEYLTQYLARQDPAEFSKRIEGKYLDYKLALHNPERFRGEPVRLFGVLHSTHVEKLELTPGNSRNVWEGYLPDPSGEECFIFQTTEPLPDTLARDGTDYVEVEGLFLMIKGYEGREGTHKQAPVILARTVRKVDPEDLKRSLPSVGNGGGGGAMMLLLPLAIIAVVAYAAIRIMMVLRKPARPNFNASSAIRRTSDYARRP